MRRTLNFVVLSGLPALTVPSLTGDDGLLGGDLLAAVRASLDVGDVVGFTVLISARRACMNRESRTLDLLLALDDIPALAVVRLAGVDDALVTRLDVVLAVGALVSVLLLDHLRSERLAASLAEVAYSPTSARGASWEPVPRSCLAPQLVQNGIVEEALCQQSNSAPRHLHGYVRSREAGRQV